MNLLNTILNILFPVNCLFCKKSGQELCKECISKIPQAARKNAEWIFPVLDYRNPVIKKSIWFLKYKGKTRLAKIFAEILYKDKMLTVLKNFSNPILIPIPIAPKRRRERGFNQTELICKELINLDKNNNFILNLNYNKNILIKPKDTAHQVKTESKQERLKNIIDTFSVINSQEIKNRNLILIDDVLTTGATLGEAKKVLKQAGAGKIIAFTIAH